MCSTYEKRREQNLEHLFDLFYLWNDKYDQDDQKQMMKDVVGLIPLDMFAYID